MICVYADESCKDNHRYLILGGISIESSALQVVLDSFHSVRKKHNTFGEVKWGKVSRQKYEFYIDFLDVFFYYSKKDILHFHYLSVDTTTFDNKTHNKGSYEIGFDKLIFQLLFHKFGKRYGIHHKLQVYLDERTTKNDPNLMTPMLNAKLKKECDLINPFSRITFQNSKTSEILQVNDLLIGAIGFRKNARHKLLDSAQHKKDFSEVVITKAIELEEPVRILSPEARKFTGWNFEFKKERVLAA